MVQHVERKSYGAARCGSALTDAVQQIGIYGGSFDPVHFGHLRPVLEVKNSLNLDQLRYIPAGNPPHKAGPRVSASHRVAMLDLAIARSPGLIIDRREVDRPKPSYTLDTLISLQSEFPAARLTLVIGMDQFIVFDTWHRWQEILALAALAVMERPGELLSDVANDILKGEFAAGISMVPVTQLAISSSRIRRELHQGTDIQFLLPYAVRQYIIDHKLYTGSAL